jgi:hypothetical protein
VDFVRVLMRYFSYAYHGLLALFLLGISLIALAGNTHTLHLDVLPWNGAALTYWLFFGALFGLIALILALKGTARVLFLVWSAIVVLMLLKGYVFSPLHFDSGELAIAVWLLGGALVALAGAWFQFRVRPPRKKLY